MIEICEHAMTNEYLDIGKTSRVLKETSSNAHFLIRQRARPQRMFRRRPARLCVAHLEDTFGGKIETQMPESNRERPMRQRLLYSIFWNQHIDERGKL